MQPEIRILPETHLVGLHTQTSLVADKTRELWQKFIPQLPKITAWNGQHFFSMQKYPANFASFTPQTVIEKWAAVPVRNLDDIPAGLTGYTLQSGKYAVFLYQGTPADFPKTWRIIFHEWLPASEYELDQRAHFEIMGRDYRPDDPNAQEEIWVPIR